MGKFSELSNTSDEEVRDAMPLPFQKARVLRVPPHPDSEGFHQVYISTHYNDEQQRAVVLAPKDGSVALPEEGEEVAVLFGAADKPLVLGSWYAVTDQYGNDRADQVPAYDPGDRIVGNGSGSQVAIRDNGTIEITTDGYKPVNVDHQSAIVYLGSDQSIPGDDTYSLLTFDTVESDPEDLFDNTEHGYVLRNDGDYHISATVEVPQPGQNHQYTLAVFVNGSIEKRKSRHSAVNQELSLDITLDQRFNADDTIDIRIRQNSGATKTVTGSELTTDFTIKRDGI